MQHLRIKSILRAQDKPVRQLAEDMGVSPQYLSSVINERHTPNLNTLIGIAEALNVPVSSLFADNEPSTYCPHCGARLTISSSIEPE